MNLYVKGELGKGGEYLAPDPHFISSISLFSNNLPWKKFKKFFDVKKIVNLTSSEQLVILRLIAIQELLCLDDDALLKWTKHQLYLFSFMQDDFDPRLPSKELLVEFRTKFDKIGLLKPFRKQCERLIREHESRFPPLDTMNNISNIDFTPKQNKRAISDAKIDLLNVETNPGITCPNCSSENVIKLKSTQEASSLPDISFSRCRFCGNTFRDKH